MSAVALPHPRLGQIQVRQGGALLSGVGSGPGLPVHESRYGALPRLGSAELVGLTESVRLTGRGGAGFPFARKLSAAAARRMRASVVVNLAEGEPASHKDAALVQVAPHLVLDGAAMTARALGTNDVHVVLPAGSPRLGEVVRVALVERSARRRDGRVRWQLHQAAERFVAGQSSAVLELMAGRPNLPVTSWRPSAESGHRRRPTLLSNAETFAHVGRLALLGAREYRRSGTHAEPGTTLLTLDGDGAAGRAPLVVEVALGTPWREVLTERRLSSPVLLGGYHGTWAKAGELAGLTVSLDALPASGLTLGAGVVLPLEAGCPVERTSRITSYLATQSAGRCGPCFRGLPALAAALEAVSHGTGDPSELRRLGDLVEGRGACAHPDGTVRLVRSMMTAFGEELSSHALGRCTAQPTGRLGALPRTSRLEANG